MDLTSDRKLEKALKSIEFPGEDEKNILRQLASRKIAESINIQSQLLKKPAKYGIWASFVALNLLLLFLLGSNSFIVHYFFAFQDMLATLFFLFLGLTFLGSLIGLILNMDTAWFNELLHKDV